MALDLNKPCFISTSDAILFTVPNDESSKNYANHLILGDYAKCTGNKDGDWLEVWCRNDKGWLLEKQLTNDRMLEINFVDIGQGDGCHIVTPDDEVILIDAGEGIGFDSTGADNMARFINWRYNLRYRKVVGVDGVTANTPKAKQPFDIDYAIISHPDLDHYYGFLNIFGNKKLRIKNVCHNGIIERPLNGADKKDWNYDLGRKVKQGKHNYLWDLARTNKDLNDILSANPTSRKMLLQTLRNAKENNSGVKFSFLHKSKNYLDHYDSNSDLQLEILAPITEKVTNGNETKDCLRILGQEGITKNGHSVVFMLKYKKVKVLLGGDLNSKSQDFIGEQYSEIDTPISKLEKQIKETREKLTQANLSRTEIEDLNQELQESTQLLDLVLLRVRKKFQCDIAKACHHGSSDILDSFLSAIHPIATVISSGDNESHSHPRPDALGAYGKASRGQRPLLFSTELARSTYEFSSPIKYYEKLKKLEAEKDALTDPKEKEKKQLEMESLKDRNVAVYGMITVRTDGEKVIIAQKLESPRSEGQKWDIFNLTWNEHLKQFEYDSEGGH
ncbi:MAG: MBL fold metallo-hydrolase [Bacteroidetes bacterium]|nr:MBL fold metallo-hydrolase [Bacteroidota bacterium]